MGQTYYIESMVWGMGIHVMGHKYTESMIWDYSESWYGTQV